MPFAAGDKTKLFDAVAEPTLDVTPSTLLHEALQPLVTVTADTEHRDIGSIAAGNTIVIPLDAFSTTPGQYALSGWVMYDATSGSNNVPDGGSTAMLLGFGFLGLALVRHYTSMQPKLVKA